MADIIIDHIITAGTDNTTQQQQLTNRAEEK
jgi:hypothetical protein